MSPIFQYAAELYREMREDFELQVEAAHKAAEEGTRGSMLNARGRREGIDAYSLMTGPWHRVRMYGSPELIEWCETEGRPSVARFEREWFAAWLGEEPLPEAVDAPLDLDTLVRLKNYPTMLGWPSLELGRIVGHESPGAGLATLYNIRMDSGARIELTSSDSFTVVHEMPTGPGSGAYQHAADC